MKMRNLTKYFLGAAVLLAGSVGFTGCTDDDFDAVGGSEVDKTGVNAGENTVAVQLALSIANDNANATTRMTAANVQADNSFRNMDEVHIIPFQLRTGANNDGDPVNGRFISEARSDVSANDLTFSSVFVNNAASTNTSFLSRVLEVALPLNTNTLVFYGKAKRTEKEYEQGSIVYNIATNFQNTYFRTRKILVDEQGAGLSNNKEKYYDQQSKMITDILTRTIRAGLVLESAATEDNTANETELSDWNALGTDVARQNYIKSHGFGIKDNYRDFRLNGWWPNTPVGNNNPSGAQVDNTQLYTLLNNTAPGMYSIKSADQFTTYYYFIDYDKTWRDYGIQYDTETDTPDNELERVDMDPLELILGELYHHFTTIEDFKYYKNGSEVAPGTEGAKKVSYEIRAGSGSAVLRMVQDMWIVIQAVAESNPTSVKEFIAQQLAERILTCINAYFGETGNYVADHYKSDGHLKGDYINSTNYKSVETIRNRLVMRYLGRTNANYEDVVTYLKDNALNNQLAGFPLNLDLPGGCAILYYSETNAGLPSFIHKSSIPNDGISDEEEVDLKNSYRYPAELCYFGNSPIRVSASDYTQSDFTTTKNYWNTVATDAAKTTEKPWGNDWTDYGRVVSSTRSVAMMYNINYGTALLQTQVGYASTSLHDNNKGIHPEESDKIIDVSSFAEDNPPFLLTGILVGGQPGTVGWDYLPIPDVWDMGDNVADATYKANLTDYYGSNNGNYKVKFDKMVYDHNMTPKTVNGNDILGYIPPVVAGASADTWSAPVYTMLWDNYDATKFNTTTAATPVPTTQNVVYVALEFINNTGDDFWGNANLVREGGTFYIIGALDPSQGALPDGFSASLQESYTNSKAYIYNEYKNGDFVHYALPPYKYVADGNKEYAYGTMAQRVFVQDHKTVAKFKIGYKSLQAAYITVPDLRSSQITLGLSVDLNWENYLTFDGVVLGGGDATEPNP